MKVALKVIKIEVPAVKVGYVVIVDNYLAEVVEIVNNEVTVSFPDGTEQSITMDAAKVSVAKFLAQTPDLRTYPMVHSDFKNLLYMLGTKDKSRAVINGKGNCEGIFKNVPVNPQNGDIVELTNIDIAENHNMKEKILRIGVLANSTGKYKYNVQFRDGFIDLNRKDFRIIGSEDCRQVFVMAD